MHTQIASVWLCMHACIINECTQLIEAGDTYSLCYGHLIWHLILAELNTETVITIQEHICPAMQVKITACMHAHRFLAIQSNNDDEFI